MMNRFNLWILVVILLSYVLSLNAQKNDYNWLSGYDSWAHGDTTSTSSATFGNVLFNFNYYPVEYGFDSLFINFDKTDVCFSDSDGNLLFYSNGVCVGNRYGKVVVNGDSLNTGWLDEVWDPTIVTYGYRTSQGILAFQDVLYSNTYYLLYTYADAAPGSGGTSLDFQRVQAAKIDMSANNEQGLVIYKNKILINGVIGAELSAVKQGNGRDWWILSQKRNTNCFYEIVIDTSGPWIKDTLCLGDTTIDGEIGASCFSNDGSKYAYLSSYTGLNVYDFDRCTGLLSNAINFPLPVIDEQGLDGLGVAFSPSGRFVYVSVTYQLYQFDLWSNSLASGLDTVGIYDGPNTGIQPLFAIEQLAPDGKIYIGCGNSTPYFHVINNPDAKGDSCNFVQRGMVLPTYCIAPPNYPNYRLGALSATGCDSLTGLSDDLRSGKEQILKAFPNPASDYVIIDYGYTDWNKGLVDLDITNAVGQVVYKQRLPMYSGFQKIDVSQFAAGMYTVFIKRSNGVLATSKFVKQ